VKDQSPDWRPATRAAWTRYIEREIKPSLGDQKPTEIRPSDVRQFADRIRRGVPGAKHGE
jgi:hypothetical protein